MEPASGGSSVAPARAGGLPLTAFTLGSADQSDVPHPNDPARNRTVTPLVAG